MRATRTRRPGCATCATRTSATSTSRCERAEGRRDRGDRQPLEGRLRPGDPEPQPDAGARRDGGPAVSATASSSFARAGSTRPTASRSSTPLGSRRASGPPGSPAASRAAARPTSGSSPATPARSSSALLLTRNAAAAAPVRVCRDECDAARDPRRRRQLRQRQRRDRRAGLLATRSRCAMRPRRARDSSRRRSRSPRPGRSASRCRSTDVLGGVAAAPPRSRPTAAADFARGDHDHRPRAEALHGEPGGVTVSAQAKGAGMTEPGFATMLCFVQTDAIVTEPEAHAARRRRAVVRADHRGRADVAPTTPCCCRRRARPDAS